jgi:hypothetical protein
MPIRWSNIMTKSEVNNLADENKFELLKTLINFVRLDPALDH